MYKIIRINMIHPKPICHVHTHRRARVTLEIYYNIVYCSTTHYIDDMIRL